MHGGTLRHVWSQGRGPNRVAQWHNSRITHRFLIASARPILPALLTTSGRLTLPIARRLSFEGLGSLSIHSGTVEPDCRITLAMLYHNEWHRQHFSSHSAKGEIKSPRFQEGCILVCEIRYGFSFSPRTARSTLQKSSIIVNKWQG